MAMIDLLMMAALVTPCAGADDASSRPVRTSDALPRVFLADARALDAHRKRVPADDPSLGPALAKLLSEADDAMAMQPVSVMDKEAVPPSGDKHDYMSLGTYWWPNPDTPDGLPYVRRDGEGNPEGNKLDSPRLARMTRAVETLALAYYFSGRERYADKASELLRVWFLNEATRMNPHLEFGQAIPGRCDGRAIGIIDTARLARLVDSIGLLERSQAWRTADQQGMRAWFEAYLTWLLESEKGREEGRQPNNHGTYYDVQVATFALFLDRHEIARKVLSQVAERRIVSQIEADGRQPLELRRTRAWDYSNANLSGMVDLATLGRHVGIDLWRFESQDGRSIRKAIDWMARVADGTNPFEYQQIKSMSYEGFGRTLRRAAVACDEPAYEELIRKLPKTDLSADRVRLIYPAFRDQTAPQR